MKALRRLVTPRGDGSYLIPKEFAEKFKDIHGGGRAEVVRMWEKHGFEKDPIYLWHDLFCFTLHLEKHIFLIEYIPVISGWPVSVYPHQCPPKTIHVLLQDSFIKSCRKKVQNITEDDLYVDGQFMSEQDMIDDNVKESLVSIFVLVSILLFG